VGGVSVGAPPDVYNQQGQDWSQPPLAPKALERTGYRIFRELVRTILKNAGAIRIDHVLGMFRLWWVPNGLKPSSGTYVYYNHDVMVGILALEAKRAGAVIIGEDLGVVPSGTFKYLKTRGILGTSILWFERERNGKPRPTEKLRRECFATVTTHDLPPTLGYLRGEHVDLRERLNLLAEDVHLVRREQEKDRARTIKYLISAGFLDKERSEDELEVTIALQRSLFNAPSLLLAFAFTDFVGESRAQNQPGTCDEYPNWRVPLEDYYGNLVFNEDLFDNQIFQRFVKSIEGIDPKPHVEVAVAVEDTRADIEEEQQ
jgi:4-alpha-glucanotransferase